MTQKYSSASDLMLWSLSIILFCSFTACGPVDISCLSHPDEFKIQHNRLKKGVVLLMEVICKHSRNMLRFTGQKFYDSSVVEARYSSSCEESKTKQSKAKQNIALLCFLIQVKDVPTMSKIPLFHRALIGTDRRKSLPGMMSQHLLQWLPVTVCGQYELEESARATLSSTRGGSYLVELSKPDSLVLIP